MIDFSTTKPGSLAGTGSPRHVAIIGGGITGLSAAFYLERAARAAGVALRCTLIEREPRLGGKIITETVDDPAGAFLVEGGPDSFVAQKPWAAQLARELGLADQLADANSAPVSTYVLRRGRPVPMPAGMQLIFPTEIMPFLRSPLLSWPGRLRMLADLWLPARRDDADETLADFIRRRFGAEALDRLAEPLLAGIHSSDPERQSLLMTFPRLREIERAHGSLIRGMAAARRARQQSAPGAKPPSPFLTLRSGIGELTRALSRQLGADVRSGVGVARIEPTPAALWAYRLWLSDGSTLNADAVIVATPAGPAADLLAPLQPALAQELRAIRSVTTGTISLAYRSEAIARPLPHGFGLVIPQSERRKINALTITSQKFAGRAPAGRTLIRAFVGGTRTPETVALADEPLLAAVRGELQAILGIAEAPLWSRIYRWPAGNPQYDLGHAERVARVERMLPDGLQLAGGSYGGVGLPDCIRQGQQAAERVLVGLQQSHRA